MNFHFLDNTQRINHIISFLFFVLSSFLYFYIYKNNFIYFVDDTGVEILQVKLFSGWPISGFIQAYETDIIESVYGYLMLPFISILGDDIFVFKLAMGLVFASTAALFFILLSRSFSLSTAILVTIAYSSSAYTIWYPSLLLRNALSPLFVILILLGLVDIYNNKVKRGCFSVILLAFLAFNAYSSLKVVIPALFASAFIAGLFLCKDKTYSRMIFLCATTISILMVALHYFTHTSTDHLLRGGYMYFNTDIYKDGELFTYLSFFVRSFFLPVAEKQSGFLAESTHFIFNRPMLNMGLYGFWAIGIVAATIRVFKQKDVVAFICLGSLLLSSFILCVGGPSLKTHFALIPLVFIVIAYAVNAILNALHFHKLIIALLGVSVLTVGYFEYMYLNKISITKFNQPDAAAQDVGLFLARNDQDFDFVLFGGAASSILRAHYPNWATKSKYVDDSDTISFLKEIDIAMQKESRLFIVVTKDSPTYLRLLQDMRFCFVQSINDSVFATLFASCNKSNN
jgi:hypothetical protein